MPLLGAGSLEDVLMRKAKNGIKDEKMIVTLLK